MSTSKNLYACIYVGDFPTQALLRLHSELEDQPCAVLDGEPPVQRVCSLNTAARKRGMRLGMTRIETDTFPGAAVLARDLQAEQAALTRLLECAGSFSPRIDNHSSAAAVLLCIDIAGTENLFGTPETLAADLLVRVNIIGLAASIVICHNIHTAACLAKGLSPKNQFQVIAAEREAEALAHLPLSVLDLTEQQAERFALWGIRTLDMLAALPEKELTSRMEGGNQLQQIARSELPYLFQPMENPVILEDRIDLDTPVYLLDSLLFVINFMLDRLLERAKERMLALASISVTLLLDGGKSKHSRTVRPALPTSDKQVWIKLLHLDLETHPPQAAVLAVALQAEPGSISKIQLGMFSPQQPEATCLDVTLARIRAIVGETNVGRAVLCDTHAPESFRVEPFTVSPGKSAAFISPQQRTAIRQLRPPETVSVKLHHLRPASFYFRERRYTVERAYGPWLTEGDWWNHALWGFEQWDLIARENEDSLLCCCMMRDLMHDRWHMVSLYD